MHTGGILRDTRLARDISQFDLALMLGVSQRHISFVEGGRSRPGRDLIVNWMTALGAPTSMRNAALLSAGYALMSKPDSTRSAADEEPMPVHHRILTVHDPLPGLIFNADWRMLQLNAGARWLFRLVMPEYMEEVGGAETSWDMIAGIGHQGGLLSRMVEPLIIARRHLTQLRLEQLNRPELKPRIDELEKVLLARFGERMNEPEGSEPEPGLNLSFDTAHGKLNFFTVQSVFKLPQDIAPTSVRTGLWYPQDEATRDILTSNVIWKTVVKSAANAA